jgi:hypothetical protein
MLDRGKNLAEPGKGLIGGIAVPYECALAHEDPSKEQRDEDGLDCKSQSSEMNSCAAIFRSHDFALNSLQWPVRLAAGSLAANSPASGIILRGQCSINAVLLRQSG